jgi:hypothetical protein
MNLIHNARAISLATAALVLLAGCDLVTETRHGQIVTTGVFVANQGNFGQGNGTITVHDPSTGQTTLSATPNLSSILQSITFEGGILYATANSANRLNVFEARTMTPLGEIADVRNPRYITFDRLGNGYVTNLTGVNEGGQDDWSGGSVTTFSTVTGTKTGEIVVGANPEGLAFVHDRVYVANSAFGDGTTVSVINAFTQNVESTIDVECFGPRSVLVDVNNQVWVVCTGRGGGNPAPGAIRLLNGRTGEILHRINLDTRLGTGGVGQDAYYAFESNELYVVAEGNRVLRIDTGTRQIQATLGPFEGNPISAIAYDPTDERMYLGRLDPTWASAGNVTIHDRMGAQLGSFGAGIAPAFILFRREAR